MNKSLSKSLYSLACLSLFLCPMTGFSEAAAQGNCDCSPRQISKAFTAVYKKASPAVVFIRCEVSPSEMDENAQGYPFPYGDDLFQRFFGIPPKSMPRQSPQVSTGSGFFISSDGIVLTNNHVIKGAEKITIVLDNDKEFDATVIGSDPHTDLAVLKVDGKNLPFLLFGDSDKVETGEWAIAIGSPFQLESTMTVGIISAKGRQDLRIADQEDFIQTDAAINPGNSGGPLLNLEAEVIGINAAILSRSGGYMGLGFSIPSNMAKNITQQIIDTGNVTRGFLGISLQPIDKDMAEAFNLEKPEGALVAEVIKDSPASKAGIKQGDIILECNGTPVKSIGSFRNEIALMQPGTTVNLKINRKGEMLTLSLNLGNATDKAATSSNSIQKLGLEVETVNSSLAHQLGISPTEEGVVITKIRPGSPAAMAGLRPGYLIQAVNHKKVTSIVEFNAGISDTSNKNRLLLLVRQGVVTRFYSIKLD